MKVILMAAVAGLSIGLTAQACTLELSMLRSALNVKASLLKWRGPVQLDKTNRQISQTVKLKNDVTVTYTAGGCEHYTYTFRYHLAEPISQNLKLQTAEMILASIPIVPEKTGEKATFLDAIMSGVIEKISQTDEPMYLPCGDATCSLETKGKHQLLTYSFAL